MTLKNLLTQVQLLYRQFFKMLWLMQESMPIVCSPLGGGFLPQSLALSIVSKYLHVCVVGIGSGISYIFNNQHKFNILALYSTFK